MGRSSHRLGGGLQLRPSEDAIQEDALLKAQAVRFDEPGALVIEKPPVTLTSSLLTCTSTGGRTATVMGMFDALFNSIRYLFIKNVSKWQYVRYRGDTDLGVTWTPTSIFCADTVGLAEGATPVTYSGNTVSYTIPADGSIVLTAWGAGGGGPADSAGGPTPAGAGGGGGGFAKGTLAVLAGDVLTVQVGQGGGGGNDSLAPNRAGGGYPDGGPASYSTSSAGHSPGSGGGSTRIYKNGVLIMVAGGGGGSGTADGGAGGGTSGDADPGGGGATGGTQSAGGLGRTDPTYAGGNGSFLQGGQGWVTIGFSGGGGGGGYYGGGGGGTTNLGVTYGGAGGSGYVNTSYLTSTTLTDGSTNTAAGKADPTYSASAGRVTGDPDTDTADGGLRDASAHGEDGNYGGNGYAVITYTKTGSNVGDGKEAPVYDWEHQLSGFAYRGYVYLTDGYFFRRLFNNAGTYVLQRVGVARPVAPSGPTESAGGHSVAGITYGWAVTFWNGVAESNFSQQLKYTALASDQQVTITIPIDEQANTGTIARRVYRTNENGEALFFVAEVADNTTTTFTDPIGINFAGDDNAVASDPAVLTPQPASPVVARVGTANSPPFIKHEDFPFERDTVERAEVWQSNLGVLGDWTDHDQPKTDEPGTIRNLRILEDVAYGILDNNSLSFSLLGGVEYWSFYNNVFIGKENGETLLDIQPFEKHMVCYTDLGVWIFRRIGVDASESILERVSYVGVCGENAVAVTDSQGHIFMGKDGIYQFTGERVVKISDVIEDIWADPTNSDYVDPNKMLSVVAYAKNDIVMFGYRTTGETNNSRGIVLDMRDGRANFATTQFNYDTLHKGFDGTVFGGTTGNTLYRVDPGSFAAEINTAVFRTPLFLIHGQLEEITLDADLAGQTVVVSVYKDDYEGTAVAIFTLTSGKNDRRQWYKRKLPITGGWERYGVQVQVVTATSAPRSPKFYKIGDWTNEDLLEP